MLRTVDPAGAPVATPGLATMAFLVTSGEMAQEAADRLSRFGESWCGTLSLLRQAGHPKWREVQPSLQLDVGRDYLARPGVLFPDCPPVADAGGGRSTASVAGRSPR